MIKRDLLPILALSLGLPSLLVGATLLTYHLFKNGVIAKIWILIVLIFLMTNFTIMTIYLFRKFKKNISEKK
ncbi:MAG: hypothetical protein HQK53_05765 [Oligoflexia bacterium]|nr:hypothetical protein [Oligoflexia bacterium]